MQITLAVLAPSQSALVYLPIILMYAVVQVHVLVQILAHAMQTLQDLHALFQSALVCLQMIRQFALVMVLA